ncbi:hypothetical protein BH09PSE4_BH09PSE4_06780 [soil metagenome]
MIARRAPAGTIIAAALLPPLGVHLDRGPGRDFWLSVALTALGFLPGVAFALHTVLLRQDRTPVPA